MLNVIAYRDQTGKDFNGTPWLHITSDNLEVAKKHTKDLAALYKDVVLFSCKDEELPEVVTWDFVYKYKIF